MLFRFKFHILPVVFSALLVSSINAFAGDWPPPCPSLDQGISISKIEGSDAYLSISGGWNFGYIEVKPGENVQRVAQEALSSTKVRVSNSPKLVGNFFVCDSQAYHSYTNLPSQVVTVHISRPN